jgi:predicted RNA binding protein YcfA (HicA-like mRNA interferase family)
MPRAPRVTGPELIAALCRLGCEEISQTGSHIHLRRPATNQVITIPNHGRKVLGVGLLAAILRQASVSRDDLRNAL